MKNTPQGPAEERAESAEGAPDATRRALESGRQFLDGAAGRMADTGRALRKHTAELARTGPESIGHAAGMAQRRLRRSAGATRGFIEARPWQSLLISAGAGALAAMMVMARLRTPAHGREQEEAAASGRRK
jgi:ElaB/YqjD/DUF883 family membrane-anchored ribosome-binding protein